MRAVSVLLATLLLACSRAPSPPPSNPPIAAPTRLTILGTSDLHGHLETLASFGGYVRVAREHAARDGAAVLLVDAGDMFQGTLESNLVEGESVVRAYDALGYAAVAVGNHEFDFGPLGPATSVPLGRESEDPASDPRGALRARARQASFPFLLANLRSPVIPLTPLRAHAMLEISGIKVGVIGITSEDTPSTTLSANVRDLQIEPPAVSAAREASTLRAAGAEVVVLLAHAGGKCARFGGEPARDECDRDAEIVRIAAALEGKVDAIVAGHSHAAVAHREHGIPIVQSYAYGRAFGRIDLILDAAHRVRASKVYPPQEICAECSYEGVTIQADAAVTSIVSDYAERTRAQRERPLGVTARAAIEGSYGAESALGDLLATLLRRQTGADVALMNGGGLRANFAAGALRYGDLYAVMPFDNRIATVRVDVAWLRALLQNNLQSTRHGFLSVAGVEVDARCEGTSLRVELTRTSGARRAKLRDGETLTLAASDFLLHGGDGFGALGDVTVTDTPLRDAFEEQLHALGTLDPAAWSTPRVRYAGARPLRCE